MSRGPQPRVSGRVETRTPRPDTVHPFEKAALTVSLFAVLVILTFGPDWLTYLISH